MDFIKKTDYYDNLLEDIKELADSSKVLVIKNIPDEVATDDFYIKIGNAIGLLIRKGFNPFTGELIDESWENIEYKKEYVYRTYKYSNKRHSLHTDFCDSSVPLDYVYLICREQAELGGETVFLDSKELIDLLQKYEPNLLEDIQKHDVVFGTKPSPIFRYTGKILSFDEDGEAILNWNYHVIAKENSKEVKEIAERFHEFLDTFVFNSFILKGEKLKKNEFVIMQDHKVLHGRNSYFGYRHMYKAAISASNIEIVKQKLIELNLSI